MVTQSNGVTGPLRWAAAWVAFDHGPACGDTLVVCRTPDGALVAVIDGLGHGAAAAEVAGQAARLVETGPLAGAADALAACHQALKRSRGAVLSIAGVHPGCIQWVGVGNVDAIVVPVTPRSPAAQLVTVAGVVGYGTPALRPARVAFRPGDVLVMWTDGLRGDLRYAVDPAWTPERLVTRLLADHWTGADDGLVFAATLGGPS